MRRACSTILVLALLLLGGCTIAGFEETAWRTTWPADAEDAFGCTPLSIDLFGGAIRGSGSGVFVSDRWLLTAAHVVPDDARYAWLWAHRPDGPVAVVLPIEVIITGGGDPVAAGDWALIRVPAMAETLDARPARLVDARDAERATLVGFPTAEHDRPRGEHEALSPREVVVLRSGATAPADFLEDDVFAGDERQLHHFRMVRGWSALGGASGGPVIVRDAAGRPGVAAIVLGRVEYRGFWRRGRAIVAHAVPPQAHLAARGLLDDLPARTEHDAVLVWDPDAHAPTLHADGDGVPQRQAAGGR